MWTRIWCVRPCDFAAWTRRQTSAGWESNLSKIVEFRSSTSTWSHDKIWSSIGLWSVHDIEDVWSFSISKRISFHLSVLYEGECGTNLADVRRDPPKSPNPTPATNETSNTQNTTKTPWTIWRSEATVLFLKHRLKTKRKNPERRFEMSMVCLNRFHVDMNTSWFITQQIP